MRPPKGLRQPLALERRAGRKLEYGGYTVQPYRDLVAAKVYRRCIHIWDELRYPGGKCGIYEDRDREKSTAKFFETITQHCQALWGPADIGYSWTFEIDVEFLRLNIETEKQRAEFIKAFPGWVLLFKLEQL